jgi:hypothetical protein
MYIYQDPRLEIRSLRIVKILDPALENAVFLLQNEW